MNRGEALSPGAPSRARRPPRCARRPARGTDLVLAGSMVAAGPTRLARGHGSADRAGHTPGHVAAVRAPGFRCVPGAGPGWRAHPEIGSGARPGGRRSTGRVLRTQSTGRSDGIALANYLSVATMQMRVQVGEYRVRGIVSVRAGCVRMDECMRGPSCVAHSSGMDRAGREIFLRGVSRDFLDLLQ